MSGTRNATNRQKPRTGGLVAGGRRLAGAAALRAAEWLQGHPSLGLGGDDHVLVLEQPPNMQREPRWGHGRPYNAPLAEVIGAHDSDYATLIKFIERYGRELAAIPREAAGSEPSWINEMFSGIDGASLYSFLRDRNPGRYFEVGSGYSTLFAHRARQDGGLRTEITSIDPMPRKEVDAVCDRAIRQRVEDVDLDLFAELEAGDMLLFDGSHRVYSNNDVSVFWLDIVPRIPPGVLVGVHDIVLPEDYPEEHYDRYWSEQYMVAVAVLFGGDRFRLVLPCHYVSVEPALRTQLMVLFDANGLAGINAYGTTFWFELDLPFARGG